MSVARVQQWAALARGHRPLGQDPTGWLTAAPLLGHRFRAAWAYAAPSGIAAPQLSQHQPSKSAALIEALLNVVAVARPRGRHARTQPSPAADDSSLSAPRRRPAAAAAVQPPPAPAFPRVELPSSVRSQFVKREWEAAISGWYKDPASLLALIDDGVALGYQGPRDGFCIRRNHPSAYAPEALAVIDKEIVDELAAGRMAGPFSEAEVRQRFAFFRTSPMAVVPKQGGEGWRIIDDLTYGGADAVNTYIPDDEAEVRYQSFDKALVYVRELGRGCWLGKIDWKSAFRQVAVAAADWPLLGLHWRDQLFVRLVLPFGARSSPARFMRFAQAFKGILVRRVGARCRVVYYLDDFLVLAPTEAECRAAMETMDELARRLGVSLHPTKREGPSTFVTFLGIGIDTHNMRVFLPQPKKAKLRAALAALAAKRAASLRQLQSAVGLMLHAAKVVEPGRLMSRRLVELVRRRYDETSPRRPLPLPSDAVDDLRWWLDCLDDWDGCSLIPVDEDWAEPVAIQTDACTSDGAGAVLFADAAAATAASPDAWLYYPWPADSPLRAWPIAALEMAAIAIALETLGPLLAGRKIRVLRVHSDSSNSVDALVRQSARNPLCMRLLRGCYALALRSGFRLKLSHISGARNVFADAASRLSSQPPARLHQLGLLPQRRLPALIPQWLLALQAMSFEPQP